ncbi:MAG: sodium ion-translocating decarboxylase subunit beta, partial [Firmicutes bacterium]|nr:sodium ion-translocating decarboxylase subunit beta [Bacillota bacterium]
MAGLIRDFIQSTGFYHLTVMELAMIAIACVLLYLGIVRKYEPLLLVPISFGMLLVNLPLAGLLQPEEPGVIGGLIYYLSLGLEKGIYPPLIFLGIGALTDFGPLIANPVTLLLGAAAQLGIFTTFTGAYLLGFTAPQSGAIGIIGGADGPTAIFVASRLAPELLGSIAIAAYSYMALVPIIQPPIMKLLTTKKEREVVMKQLRPV